MTDKEKTPLSVGSALERERERMQRLPKQELDTPSTYELLDYPHPTTDTKPTVEFPNLEALAQGCMSGNLSEWPQLKVEAAKVIALLQSIRSAEMPVEPTMLSAMRLVGNAPEVIAHVDALKSYALKLKHNGSVTMDELGEMRDRAEKAEAELAALRGRLMEPEHKQKCDLLGQPVIGAMSAVAPKEGK